MKSKEELHLNNGNHQEESLPTRPSSTSTAASPTSFSSAAASLVEQRIEEEREKEQTERQVLGDDDLEDDDEEADEPDLLGSVQSVRQLVQKFSSGSKLKRSSTFSSTRTCHENCHGKGIVPKMNNSPMRSFEVPFTLGTWSSSRAGHLSSSCASSGFGDDLTVTACPVITRASSQDDFSLGGDVSCSSSFTTGGHSNVRNTL